MSLNVCASIRIDIVRIFQQRDTLRGSLLSLLFACLVTSDNVNMSRRTCDGNVVKSRVLGHSLSTANLLLILV